MTVGRSGGFLRALDAAELDLVQAKTLVGVSRADRYGRKSLVWVSSDPVFAEPNRPLPLILYPPPSFSRAIALETLEGAGRSWCIVCTGSSFRGLNSAPLAGLGIAVQGDGFVPAGLSKLCSRADSPR